jgi:hypothetical protein
MVGLCTFQHRRRELLADNRCRCNDFIDYQGFRCSLDRKDFKRVEAAIPGIHSKNQFVFPLVSKKIIALPNVGYQVA